MNSRNSALVGTTVVRVLEDSDRGVWYYGLKGREFKVKKYSATNYIVVEGDYTNGLLQANKVEIVR